MKDVVDGSCSQGADHGGGVAGAMKVIVFQCPCRTLIDQAECRGGSCSSKPATMAVFVEDNQLERV